jgi:hypothetical protein
MYILLFFIWPFSFPSFFIISLITIQLPLSLFSLKSFIYQTPIKLDICNTAISKSRQFGYKSSFCHQCLKKHHQYSMSQQTSSSSSTKHLLEEVKLVSNLLESLNWEPKSYIDHFLNATSDASIFKQQYWGCSSWAGTRRLL